ncbi:MAG: transposase family protein [Methylococcaceae bacterium]|nr:transposase family protein [Methylococcaceae bacterium]
MSSRRQANAQMSKPGFREALQSLFPELESMPHVDTLNRVLEKLDTDVLLSAHLALIKRFIRSKKFTIYLIQNCYPIAIDRTQKLARDGHWRQDE